MRGEDVRPRYSPRASFLHVDVDNIELIYIERISLGGVGQEISPHAEYHDDRWKGDPGRFHPLEDTFDEEEIEWPDEEDVDEDQQRHEGKWHDLDACELVERAVQLPRHVAKSVRGERSVELLLVVG